MRARILVGPAIAAAAIAVLLAVACTNDSLPEGEFPLDAAALDLRSCQDGSPPMMIQSLECPAAECPGSVAWAICTGSVYGACTCKGPKAETDAPMADEPFPTGSGEASLPEGGPSEAAPEDGSSDDAGPDSGKGDSGTKDSGSKDAGHDAGAVDAGKDSGKKPPKDSGEDG